MRVTTTEANDIFDEEIWNPCACSHQNIAAYHEEMSIDIRDNPEEEYFRLVSSLHLALQFIFALEFMSDSSNLGLCFYIMCCSRAWH